MRGTDIGSCYEALGPNLSKSILGFYVFTGCDQIGRFSGKSKSALWDVYFNSEDTIIEAFSKLGVGENLPTLETQYSIEKFVVKAYGENKGPATITLSEVRWQLFSKYQYDAEKLPSTSGALKYRVFRCHYVTAVLRRANQTMQNLPPAVDYGWELNDSSYILILTENLPAPLELIELSVCSCKSDCSTKRCKCNKNGLICTDMCKCLNCKNNDDESGIVAPQDIELDDFDDFI